jgi:hypothetical protein
MPGQGLLAVSPRVEGGVRVCVVCMLYGVCVVGMVCVVGVYVCMACTPQRKGFGTYPVIRSPLLWQQC